MQFFKQIKNKALTIPIFDKKSSKQQNSCDSQQEAGKRQQKDRTITGMAMSFFNKFKQQKQNHQQTQTIKAEQKIVTKPVVYEEGRIWMTAPAPKPPPTIETNVLKIPQNNPKSNIQLDVVDSDSAEQFIRNMYNFINDEQKAKKMRINKAKNQIFGILEIQPIYLADNGISKILKMELETEHEHLIERTQNLVMERISVDKSIESALNSGYLWKAHGQENRSIMEACFEVIESSYTNIRSQLEQVHEIRSKFQLMVSYIKKVVNLNRRRAVLAKKIHLLNKIKSYKKETSLQAQNIDQAFYIERGRQKLYQQLKYNQKLLQKVVLLQSFVAKIERQNAKVVSLVEQQLIRWIDEGQKIQPKIIQKLLILLYFIRNQKMYSDKNLSVNLIRLKNRDTLIKQLNEVKLWKDYKYVNDRAIKAKVSEYLDALITWLTKENQKESRDAKGNKKIKLISLSVEQKQENVIKF